MEQRLEEQQAMVRTRKYATLDANQVAADAPSRVSLLRNTMVSLVLFGTLGGMLAWVCGFMTQLRSSEQQAIDLLHGIHRIEYQREENKLTAEQTSKSIEIISSQGRSNPYFNFDQ